MRFIAAGLLLCASLAHAGVPVTSEHMSSNFDGTIDSRYPNGDKPQDSCDEPDGWTVIAKGDAAGQICGNSATQFTITASGTNDEGNILLAYKSCSTGDCELIAGVPGSVDWIGHTETFTSFGVGISEGTGDSAWYMQANVTPDGRARCKAGTPGPDDYNSTASAGLLAPFQIAIAHDDANDELRCLLSTDSGASWTSFGIYPRDLAEPAIGYVFGTSHDTSESTTVTITDIAFDTAISTYTPDPPDPPVDPNQAPVCSQIENQSGTQGIAFSLNVSASCSDPDDDPLTYSATGLSGRGLSISSGGVISGTPNSTAVSDSPFNVIVTVTDDDGAETQVTFQMNVIAAAGSGDTFTISSGATPAAYVFNCNTVANCGPGDTIVLGGGVHNNRTLKFLNLRGTASSPITITNDTTAGSRTTIRVPSGKTRASLWCENCEYVKITGLGGWSGQAGRCGVTETPNGVQDDGEDAVDEYHDGCGIYIDGATNSPSQDAVLLQGWPRSHVTIEGIEMVGDWSGPGDSNYTEAHGINFNDSQVLETDPNVTEMDGNTVRHNYIHHFNDSAMYLGGNIRGADGANEPNQKNLLIEYNVWDTIGAGGAKIKHVEGSNPGAAIIRYNHGRNGGGSTEEPESGHNSILFSCYEASCEAYGNILDTTVDDTKDGPGLTCNIQHRFQAWGTQVCRFYNNVILNTASHGIAASRSNTSGKGGSHTTAQMQIETEFNTIVDAGQEGGNCVNAASTVGSGHVINTICAGTTTIGGANLTKANNQTGSVASQNFNNAAGKDYRLKTNSPAKDAAVGTCPNADLLQTSRPVGAACDAGAYEFVP